MQKSQANCCLTFLHFLQLGHSDLKYRSPVFHFFLCQPDGPAMGQDYFLGNGKSQTAAAPGSGPIPHNKGREEVFAQVSGNSLPVVCDFQKHSAGNLFQFHPDQGAQTVVLQCIGKNIVHRNVKNEITQKEYQYFNK